MYARTGHHPEQDVTGVDIPNNGEENFESLGIYMSIPPPLDVPISSSSSYSHSNLPWRLGGFLTSDTTWLPLHQQQYGYLASSAPSILEDHSHLNHPGDFSTHRRLTDTDHHPSSYLSGHAVPDIPSTQSVRSDQDYLCETPGEIDFLTDATFGDGDDTSGLFSLFSSFSSNDVSNSHSQNRFLRIPDFHLEPHRDDSWLTYGHTASEDLDESIPNQVEDVRSGPQQPSEESLANIKTTSKPRGRKGRLSDTQRLEANHMRKIKACVACKKRKVKVRYRYQDGIHIMPMAVLTYTFLSAMRAFHAAPV